MKKFLPILSFAFALSLSKAEAKYEVLGEWLKEIAPTDIALIEFQRTELGGVSLDGNAFYINSPIGTLEKRELKTGAIIWATKLEGVSQSLWTLSGTELFGGDTRGTIYSVDSKTGKIKWKAQTKGVFFSKPLVKNDQIWIMNSLGSLQSYEKETGKFLWQQSDPANTATALWSFQGPVSFQNWVVAGFPSAVLQAFDPLSGKVIWNESFQSSSTGTDSFNDLKAVSVAGDTLFASSYNGDLRVWQATSGSKKLLWQKKLALHSPITMDENGSLYISARDGTIQALEGKTGFVKWQLQLTRGLGTQVSISKSNLWIGTSVGEVYVLSKDGKLLAKSSDYQSPIWNAPTVLNDEEALVYTGKANLRRLHLVKTGT